MSPGEVVVESDRISGVLTESLAPPTTNGYGPQDSDYPVENPAV